ncbi:MAG: polyprenyl synthetase family protein [Bacteroidota bacterium]
MVESLNSIKAPIESELKVFEQRFREAMKSHVPLLDKITYYIVQRKGKQIRPMFVLLCARLFGEVKDSGYIAASMIELLHTATLVHDDVVDDSFERRGFFSINALWKNKIAVLVGDYLFSQGMVIALKNNAYRIFQIVATAMKNIIEGELLQSEKARRLDINEDIYYEIIRQKTASLIAAACACGAAAADQDEDTIERVRLFGEKIGIAFQIKDDLFDFGSADVGKPLGIDIKEKKMTLPLIYALNHCPPKQARRIINTIKRNNNNPEKVKEVIEFVNNSGGIEYAREAMLRYRNEAFQILQELPDVPARESLKQLVIFVTDRNK